MGRVLQKNILYKIYFYSKSAVIVAYFIIKLFRVAAKRPELDLFSWNLSLIRFKFVGNIFAQINFFFNILHIIFLLKKLSGNVLSLGMRTQIQMLKNLSDLQYI